MLNTRDRTDRQIRAAVRESKALFKKRYRIVKLDEPIQRGWRRYYALTECASRRRDSAILEAIVRVIGPVIVHHRRDFRKKRRRSRKFVEIEQPLRPIPTWEWERKNYPAEWLTYFRYELLLRNRHWQPYWVFRQSSIYELKIARNWVWEGVEIDPLIEARLSELNRWLDARRGWERYGWLKGKQQSYRWEHGDGIQQRSLTREHRREIARAYDNFPEVDPAASCGVAGSASDYFSKPRCSPTSRDTPFRREPVRVQVLPPGPLSRLLPYSLLAPVAQRRGSGLKPRAVSVQVRPGAFSSAHASPTSRGVEFKPRIVRVQLRLRPRRSLRTPVCR
jgi:hypothetical protein